MGFHQAALHNWYVIYSTKGLSILRKRANAQSPQNPLFIGKNGLSCPLELSKPEVYHKDRYAMISVWKNSAETGTHTGNESTGIWQFVETDDFYKTAFFSPEAIKSHRNQFDFSSFLLMIWPPSVCCGMYGCTPRCQTSVISSDIRNLYIAISFCHVFFLLIIWSQMIMKGFASTHFARFIDWKDK